MSEVLKKFGRYFLLDRVAQGGMAEIYRARLAATTGPSRLVVIKRIQQGYGSNAEFIQMFKSETQVTMAFNHPNIVQVYDFGEEKEQPYIAMEFVDGRNLRQILQRAAELKKSLPVDLVAHLVEQAAAGLHYAHVFKDKISGDSLSIVHRDVSPQNILVSYDGGVKVIDFGIAKASTNGEATRAGIIKGKPSYLSPEQISGDVLDGRCDIFSLGAVLWELLTGKKLFAGESDLAVLKMIEACTTYVKPPSALNLSIPRELDYIVLKALAKNRDQRYQTADEMRRELHKFVQGVNPDFSSADLSFFAKDLFKQEIVEDRKRVQKLNEKAEELLALDQESMAVQKGPAGVLNLEEDTTSLYEPARVSSGNPKAPIVATPVADPVPVTRVSSTVLDAPVSSAQIHVDRSAADPGTHSLKAPKSAWKSAGTRSVSRKFGSPTSAPEAGRKNPFLIVVAGIAALLVAAPMLGIPMPWSAGPLSRTEGRSGASVDTAPGAKEVKPKIEEVIPAPKSALTIPLRLNITPFSGGSVMANVNGKEFDAAKQAPAVALDEPLELVVKRQGYKDFKREFVLNSADLKNQDEYVMEVSLEPLRYGFLTIRTTPSSDAYLTQRDGARSPTADKPLIRRTPFENEKFPIGTYSIRLVNEVLGMEKIVTVTVQEGRAFTVDERLEIRE